METSQLILMIALIVLSAIFSGLTIGMFTLDVSDLERKAKNGNKKAIKVLRIRKNGNMLLCTLLISNSLVNSALSQVIGDSFNGVMGLILSTVLIFLFGELVPQAAFSRHALDVGARMAWMVQLFMYILWPITKPISFILDKIFGGDISKFYDRGELRDFIESHEKDGEIIDADERRIMIGAMLFSEKVAEDIMTPSTVCFTIDGSKSVEEMREIIADKAFSRIPVWEDRQDNVISILITKDLVGNNFVGKSIKDASRGKVLRIAQDLNLDQTLNLMIREKSHIACVYNNFGTLLGIVTMEDVIEVIMRVEIMDESDDSTDLREVAEEMAPEMVRPEEELIEEQNGTL